MALADVFSEDVHCVGSLDLQRDLGVPDRHYRIDHVLLRGRGHDLIVADEVDFDRVGDFADQISRGPSSRVLVLRLFHKNR